jgi:hypothetical protein
MRKKIAHTFFTILSIIAVLAMVFFTVLPAFY